MNMSTTGYVGKGAHDLSSFRVREDTVDGGSRETSKHVNGIYRNRTVASTVGSEYPGCQGEGEWQSPCRRLMKPKGYAVGGFPSANERVPREIEVQVVRVYGVPVRASEKRSQEWHHKTRNEQEKYRNMRLGPMAFDRESISQKTGVREKEGR